MKARIRAGILALIGYILSPLSWWNDPFVNLPLAYLFASAISLLSRRLFLPGMVAGYWITNVTGIILMARGTTDMVTGTSEGRKRKLLLSLAMATGYTALVVALSLLGVLRPLHHFLGRR